IILLCAPAGYGKTTLAREWAATRDEPVAWYGAGPEASDVAALAVDVAEVLSLALSEDETVASLPERVRHLAARGLDARVLTQATVSSLPDPGPTLVIDDYHEVRSAEAEKFMSALAAAEGVRMLVASRSRPRWVTARMEVYGSAFVIDKDNLSFSEDEGRDVL